tara:strand:+ start:545 stop:868 length:324 start_codon:yes stop_codon:yes gene_type:complete
MRPPQQNVDFLISSHRPPERESSVTQWGELDAELTNKIRWAIGSTLNGGGGFNIPYSQSMGMARFVTGLVVEVMKEKEAKPDLDMIGYMKATRGNQVEIPKNQPVTS